MENWMINQEDLEAWIETIELLKDPNLLLDIEEAKKEYIKNKY